MTPTQTIKKIDELKASFKYRIDVKDFIYGSKRTALQKSEYRKLLNNFGIFKEPSYRCINNFGDIFIQMNSDETVCYHENYSRFGPYYCVIGFKNRQQSLKTREILKAIRSTN